MNSLTEENYWDNEWKGIFEHYQNDRRFAYYLRAILLQDEQKLLEIGAGSFRDMQLLNSSGIDCTGVDFSETAVNLAKKMYPNISSKITHGNAFSLPFEDSTFDLTYHNGFWVCFEDHDISKLLEEQIRVSKNRVVACVHNAHNKQFKAYFDTLKDDNTLYSCRFFEVEEIISIMSSKLKDITVIPVGKGKKTHEDYLINLGLSQPEHLRKCFNFHGSELLNSSERLLCIGTI